MYTFFPNFKLQYEFVFFLFFFFLKSERQISVDWGKYKQKTKRDVDDARSKFYFLRYF